MSIVKLGLEVGFAVFVAAWVFAACRSGQAAGEHRAVRYRPRHGVWSWPRLAFHGAPARHLRAELAVAG